MCSGILKIEHERMALQARLMCMLLLWRQEECFESRVAVHHAYLHALVKVSSIMTQHELLQSPLDRLGQTECGLSTSLGC